MSRAPRVTAREALAALSRAGFVLDHVTGSHHILIGPSGQRAVVPAHAGETLRPKTLLSILRQAGLSIEEFMKLL